MSFAPRIQARRSALSVLVLRAVDFGVAAAEVGAGEVGSEGGDFGGDLSGALLAGGASGGLWW